MFSLLWTWDTRDIKISTHVLEVVLSWVWCTLQQIFLYFFLSVLEHIFGMKLCPTHLYPGCPLREKIVRRSCLSKCWKLGAVREQCPNFFPYIIPDILKNDLLEENIISLSKNFCFFVALTIIIVIKPEFELKLVSQYPCEPTDWHFVFHTNPTPLPQHFAHVLPTHLWTELLICLFQG